MHLSFKCFMKRCGKNGSWNRKWKVIFIPPYFHFWKLYLERFGASLAFKPATSWLIPARRQRIWRDVRKHDCSGVFRESCSGNRATFKQQTDVPASFKYFRLAHLGQREEETITIGKWGGLIWEYDHPFILADGRLHSGQSEGSTQLVLRRYDNERSHQSTNPKTGSNFRSYRPLIRLIWPWSRLLRHSVKPR